MLFHHCRQVETIIELRARQHTQCQFSLFSPTAFVNTSCLILPSSIDFHYVACKIYNFAVKVTYKFSVFPSNDQGIINALFFCLLLLASAGFHVQGGFSVNLSVEIHTCILLVILIFNTRTLQM